MADNLTLNSGSGGSTLATDDVTDAGGAHYQRVKLTDGTANSSTVIAAGNGVSAGALRVTVSSDSTGVLSVDDNGSTLSVDDGAGSLTVDNGGTFAVQAAVDELPAAAALTDTFSNPTTTQAAAMGMVWNGTTWDRAPGTAAGGLTVDLGTNNDVTVSGVATAANQLADGHNVTVDNATGAGAVNIQDGGNSITVDGTVTANPASGTIDTVTNLAQMGGVAISLNTGLRDTGTQRVTVATDDVVPVTGTVTAVTDITNTVTVDNAGTFAVQADLGVNNDVTVTGGNAHDGTTLGNPVLGGARATNSVEGVTQVANADLTLLQADLNGVVITRPHTTLEEILSDRVADTAGTSAAFTNMAAGGAGVHNYVTTISIYNSSATDGYVDFRDGTAGAVIFTAAAPAAGGSVITFPVPLKGAANTALAYDVSGALTTVYITVVGFQAQG